HSQVECDAIDREQMPRALAGGDREIAHGEEGLDEGVRHEHPNVLRGSNASRTASPMKINSESMNATVMNPQSPSHGAWMLALPCASNSPSEGEPGGRPKPRKSSAVSVITEDDTMNGRNV